MKNIILLLLLLQTPLHAQEFKSPQSKVLAEQLTNM